MFHSLSNNMASPKSFNPSNGPFAYPAPAQTRGEKKSFFAIVQSNSLNQGSEMPGTFKHWPVSSSPEGNTLIPGNSPGAGFWSSPTLSSSLEPGTQMTPTNHLRLMICQYLQDHRKNHYISVSTPKLNWEKRAQQRKHFKFKKLTAFSTFLFLSIATNTSTWKDLCGVLMSLTIFSWNLLIKHHY